MRIFSLVVVLLFSGFFFASAWAAQVNVNGFMTPRDILTSTSSSNSNTYLQNSRGATMTVYGLYIRQFAEVTPGHSCQSPTVLYPADYPLPNSNIPANVAAGAVLTPTIIHAGQSAAIGANFLYNMIFNATYYLRLYASTSAPGCSLPGCTWGSDSTVYNWCVYVGALGPVSTSAGYTSTVPPEASEASHTTGPSDYYDYNLINSGAYHYIGPIFCNDQTLTCSVASPQTQSF